MITQETLRQYLLYDSDTGVFRWRLRPSRNSAVHVGDIAGSLQHDGHWVIGFRRRTYQAHRLAWLYIHGCWPKGEIDHINRIKADNRISNLRDVSTAENQHNRCLPLHGSSVGMIGVTPHKQSGKFQAAIRAHGKSIYLGLFETPEQASAAYWKAKGRFHPTSPVTRAA